MQAASENKRGRLDIFIQSHEKRITLHTEQTNKNGGESYAKKVGKQNCWNNGNSFFKKPVKDEKRT